MLLRGGVPGRDDAKHEDREANSIGSVFHGLLLFLTLSRARLI
jgi:hypothetical protein